MIPLRNRESFFRDPFFSDCWDMMDRRRKDWESECNLRSKNFFSDMDDIDIGGLHHHREIGHSPLSRIFSRGTGGSHDILEKEQLSSDGFGLQSDKDKFKVLLDVQQFNPEELVVKTCDNSIVIEGKHEEKKDPHGFVSRHFTRKYTLPSDVKVEDVQCNLSSDGVLHVTAPRLNPALTNKTASSTSKASTVTSTEQSRKSSEQETLSSSSASTTKEYPDQIRTTPEKDLGEKREEQRSSEKEESSSIRSEKIGVGVNKSSFTGHLRDTDRRHNRIFDSYFAGFPDFDLVPFWRRRDWSGGQGEIIERQKSSRNEMGVLSDRDNFKVQLDVQQFTPEELSVKTIDNFLVVDGKHEEKKDSLGWVTRHFTRKYEIPSDVKPESVQCNFSTDGLLLISAPRQKPQLTNEKVTVIPIKVKHLSGKSTDENFSVEESTKQHTIHVDKHLDNSAPLTTTNGVLIEEQISRSSSNQDAHKEMNKQQPQHQEGIVEHIIPITNGA